MPIVLLVIFGVIVVAAGGYSYQKNLGNISDKLNSAFSLSTPEDPSEITARAFESLSKARSFHLDSEISGVTKKKTGLNESTLKQKTTNTSTMLMRFNGVVNVPQLEFDGSFMVETSGATSYKFTLQAKKVASTTYFNLSESPKELSLLTNQWIGINGAEIKKRYGNTQIVEKVEKFDRAKMVDLFTKARALKIFKVTQEFPEEKIGETLTRHFRFTFDTQVLEKLIEGNPDSGQKPLDTEREARLRALSAKIDDYTKEVWIGKDDLMPYKLSIVYVGKVPPSEIDAPLVATFFFDAFNESVSIEKPVSSKTLEETLQAISLKLFPSATIKAKR